MGADGLGQSPPAIIVDARVGHGLVQSWGEVLAHVWPIGHEQGHDDEFVRPEHLVNSLYPRGLFQVAATHLVEPPPSREPVDVVSNARRTGWPIFISVPHQRNPDDPTSIGLCRGYPHERDLSHQGMGPYRWRLSNRHASRPISLDFAWDDDARVLPGAHEVRNDDEVAIGDRSHRVADQRVTTDVRREDLVEDIAGSNCLGVPFDYTAGP